MDLVVHFDEICLKGNNQKSFLLKLKNNIENNFKKSHCQRTESGFWVENIADDDLDRFSKIPGIANFSPGFKIESDYEKIKERILSIDWGNFQTFRIRSERSYKDFPLNSQQIEKEVGALVAQKFGYKVKLVNPDLTIHIDIGSKNALIYGNQIKGAGGLPVGISKKILCLLSGGIDSPVAAYKMMVRGAEVELIHFQNQTHVTEEVSQKIFDLTKTLAKFQGKIDLHIVPFAHWQKEIIMKIPADFRMIVTRRLMFKIAANLASKKNILALASGDNLGQVASQTLENLTAVYDSTPMLKLTPLISENKSDIIALARKIGTLEISNLPYEDCCSLFVSKHPETKSNLNKVLDLEARIDLKDLYKTEIISYHIGM